MRKENGTRGSARIVSPRGLAAMAKRPNFAFGRIPRMYEVAIGMRDVERILKIVSRNASGRWFPNPKKVTDNYGAYMYIQYTYILAFRNWVIPRWRNARRYISSDLICIAWIFSFFFWQKKNCVEILKRTHLRVKLTFSDRFRERCEPSTLQNCQSIAAM